MKVAILYSGGKDSTFALSWAEMQGWEVCGLVTLASKNRESYMFHTPNIWMVKLQAECLDLPLIFFPTIGEKETELSDLRAALSQAKKRWNITGLVTGAVASNYQEERINRVCHELELKTFAPLWHKKQEQLVEEMISSGFEFYIQSIAADGLDEKWLGRRIDAQALEELKKLHKKNGLHIAGEGGEYESIVLDSPLFRKKIIIQKAHTHMEEKHTGVWVIEKAMVQDK